MPDRDVPPSNGTRYMLADHDRRLKLLEEVKPGENLAVLQSQFDTLRDEVRGLKKAFYTFAFGVVGGAVIFAFTAFEILGQGAH